MREWRLYVCGYERQGFREFKGCQWKKRVGEIKNESVVLQDGVLNQNQEKESACSERFWGMDWEMRTEKWSLHFFSALHLRVSPSDGSTSVSPVILGLKKNKKILNPSWVLTLHNEPSALQQFLLVSATCVGWWTKSIPIYIPVHHWCCCYAT